MKALLLTFGSFMLTTGVILNAYVQKKQFYPSVVYLSKSNPSMAVFYLQAFVFVVLMGKLFRKIFFGSLRAAEMEHLIERSWYAVTETCLAFTVFRDDFSSRFVALFTLLLFLKCFHWLAEDRIDYMERSPVISWLFHIRALSLTFLLGAVDVSFVHHAYYSTLMKGASVQLVFGFEYAVLFTVVATIFIKYVLHTIDLQSENPWENKAVYLLHAELILGFIRMLLYVMFLVIMTKVHTFPLFAIRPMYLCMRAFKKALNDVILSRRAIRNMNSLYPDATVEELTTGDNVCIICREEMVNNCKKLPCNHIFHTSCLRSWFQRQQTCPTCRLDVLRPTPRPAQQQPAAQPAQPDVNQQQPQGMFPGMPGGFPMFMPPQAQPQPQPQPQPGGVATSSAATGATTSPTPTSMTPTNPMMPPMAPSMAAPPFMMPPFMPSPMPFPMPVPPNGEVPNLSLEELRAMEGNERQHVQARIRVLQDIKTLLDAAMVQMQQYTAVVNNPNINVIGQTGNTDQGQTSGVFTYPGTKTTTTTVSTASESKPSVPKTQSPDYSLPKPVQPSSYKDSKPESKSNEPDWSELGASGYTPPAETIPDWHDDRLDSAEDENIHSLRRRRLEKFSSQTSTTAKKENEIQNNVELD